jgi:GNAT superfamily N-acetyltransferase
MHQVATPPPVVRALNAADLADVIAIDSALEGRSRRGYAERRLAAARRDPALHAQFAAVDERGLAGYILARMLEGEFGSQARSMRIELVGVRPDIRGHGVGRKLFDALSQWAGRHAVTELRTQSAWSDAAMLHWLAGMGFELAPALVVECAVAGGDYRPERDDAIALRPDDGPAQEVRFDGDGAGNDFERLARDSAEVRSMTAADLPGIVRIDRGITGRDRTGYLKAKLAEAMDDSTVRVSLCARRDDASIGFLMARVDRGDFGRTEPVAVIDTIGVDREYMRHGIGRALLSQLFVNLGALRVERVETFVAASDLALLGFLYGVGFVPSQRLPFVRQLGTWE